MARPRIQRRRVAIDPSAGMLVVNTQRVAALIRLIPRPDFEAMFAEARAKQLAAVNFSRQ